jgi:hypothetical protein
MWRWQQHRWGQQQPMMHQCAFDLGLTPENQLLGCAWAACCLSTRSRCCAEGARVAAKYAC